MPRDVVLGEGYDGDTQLASHAPGHHNGQFWLDDGSRTLMQVGDIPDQGYGIGGMGDIAASFAQMIVGDSLDTLRKGLFKLQDDLSQVIGSRKSVLDGYMEAKSILADTASNYGGMTTMVLGVTVPNPNVVPAMYAVQTAVETVKLFAAQVHMLEQLYIVYSKIGEALSSAGLTTDADMVSTSLYRIQAYVTETDALFSPVPEYQQTKNAIIASAQAERTLWGVPLDAYDDPRWLQAYLQGASKVVPLPYPDDVKNAAGLSGLGADPLTVVVVIIATIVAVGIAVSLIVVAVRAVPDANLKAKAASSLLLAAEQRKKETEAQIRAQAAKEGVSAEETQKRVDAAMKSIDEQTKSSVKDLPDAPSLFGSILGPLGIAAAGLVAYLALK